MAILGKPFIFLAPSHKIIKNTFSSFYNLKKRKTKTNPQPTFQVKNTLLSEQFAGPNLFPQPPRKAESGLISSKGPGTLLPSFLRLWRDVKGGRMAKTQASRKRLWLWLRFPSAASAVHTAVLSTLSALLNFNMRCANMREK